MQFVKELECLSQTGPTMLSFAAIDLNISRKNLKLLLNKVVDKTFNRISVDGDMSTNDSVAQICHWRKYSY
ncbi:MAG: hypothetical protein Ct9H90mP3_8650 [Flammeovirgaceae bacterium]|nr:MAG: hypothetical protein Ct9H90mP3_8650 [Flammeovirgaceae bacterium]